MPFWGKILHGTDMPIFCPVQYLAGKSHEINKMIESRFILACRSMKTHKIPLEYSLFQTTNKIHFSVSGLEVQDN